MRSTFALISTFALLALLQGCAAGPNPAVDMAAADGGTAGFFAGLWHGMIWDHSEIAWTSQVQA